RRNKSTRRCGISRRWRASQPLWLNFSHFSSLCVAQHWLLIIVVAKGDVPFSIHLRWALRNKTVTNSRHRFIQASKGIQQQDILRIQIIPVITKNVILGRLQNYSHVVIGLQSKRIEVTIIIRKIKSLYAVFIRKIDSDEPL